MYDRLPDHTAALAQELGITAIVVGRGIHPFAAWGEFTRALNVRSVRKSLISALFGAASVDKPFDLAVTLQELGINDREPILSDRERHANIRDLLMARSGIYHAAAYEPPAMKAKRPLRGSHPSGSHWYYNNWDFNVAGVIYEQITGEDIYESFKQRIADRIGMQNFIPSRCRRVFEQVTDHPAHTFYLSAEDLVLLGLLFLNNGHWRGQTVIPSSWIEESTTRYSPTDVGRLGYGYLWWVAPEDSALGANAYFALGAGGQGLPVMPDFDLVVAQTVDVSEGHERLSTSHFVQIVRQLVEFYASSR